MNYTVKNDWKYTAKKGYYFRNGEVISDVLYMGKNDSIDNWEVITEAEKATIEAEIEAKRKEEEKAQALAEIEAKYSEAK